MSINAITQVPETMTSASYLDQSGLGKEAFLKLLVAQMTNQDPMEPMDNQDFLGQLSQYSSLEQLMNLNDTLNMNNDLTMSVHNALMMNLIGKDVKVLGDILQWSDNATAKISYTLPQAGNISVQILDDSGNVVRTLDEGLQAAGDHVLEWDGRDGEGNLVPSGNYRVNVFTQEDQDTASQAPTYIIGRVTGIQYIGGNPVPYIGDQAVNPADIVAIYEPSLT